VQRDDVGRETKKISCARWKTQAQPVVSRPEFCFRQEFLLERDFRFGGDILFGWREGRISCARGKTQNTTGNI